MVMTPSNQIEQLASQADTPETSGANILPSDVHLDDSCFTSLKQVSPWVEVKDHSGMSTAAGHSPQTQLGSDDSELRLLSALDDGAGPMMSLDKYIIFVLKCAPTRSLSLSEIESKIRGNFASFRADSALQLSISQVLQGFDFPAVAALDDAKQLTFTLRPGADTQADDQLQLDPSRPTMFWSLPLRVRLQIYRWVLHLPLPKGCAWSIFPTPTYQDICRLRHVDYHDTDAMQTDNVEPPETTQKHLVAEVADGKWALHSRPMNEILALAMVNRQLYAEAMPTFYAHNTFHFSCAIGLESFLRGIPCRRMFLQRLSIHYDPPLFHRGSWRAAFKLLQESGLRYLRLELREEEVMGLGEGYARAEQMPGFGELGKVRGVEVIQMVGSFEKTKRFLGKIMNKKEALVDQSAVPSVQVKIGGKRFDLALDRERLADREFALWRKAHAKEIAKKVKDTNAENKAKAQEDEKEQIRKDRQSAKAARATAKRTVKAPRQTRKQREQAQREAEREQAEEDKIEELRARLRKRAREPEPEYDSESSTDIESDSSKDFDDTVWMPKEAATMSAAQNAKDKQAQQQQPPAKRARIESTAQPKSDGKEATSSAAAVPKTTMGGKGIGNATSKQMGAVRA